MTEREIVSRLDQALIRFIEQHGNRVSMATAEALVPVVQAIAAETAAAELDRAIREHRTTVAKLGPVERLTCFLVKAEDLVIRAAELRSRP